MALRRLDRPDLGRAAGLLAIAFAVIISWVSPASAAPPSGREDAPPATAPPTGSAEDVQAPQALTPLAWTYPPALADRDQPPTGTVILRYVVGSDGVPREITVQQSVDPQLDQSVIDALSALRFSPGTYRGQPVEIVLTLVLPVSAPAERLRGSAGQDRQGEASVDSSEASVAGPPQDPGGEPDGPPQLRGRVRAAGDRVPIEGVRVLLVPADPNRPLGRVKRRQYAEPKEPAWQRATISQADGTFALAGAPAGRAMLVLIAPGFARQEWIVDILDGRVAEVSSFLEPDGPPMYRTTVTTERERVPEVAQRNISAEEIRTVPGTQGDALKTIQNFPGVARAPFGAGLLVIRGAAPGDSATFLAGHEIPLLFHFGGLTSVFNADILQQIEFVPGNFDSRYGDAIGGIVNVVPRKGRRDGVHGYLDADLFDAGALLEGPLGRKGGSFIVSARRSYIDFILPRVIPEDAGLGLTVAPRYSDYQVLFDHPIGGGELTARAFGSSDRLALLFQQPNDSAADSRSGVTNTTYFHRFDLSYRARMRDWDVWITPSFLHSKIGLRAFDLFRFELYFNTVSNRAEIGRKIGDRLALRLGTELVATYFVIDLRAPQTPESGSANPGQFGTAARGWFAAPALYATGTVRLAQQMHAIVGVRGTAYTAPMGAFTLDPRLRLAWNVADRTTLTAGVGAYSQAPSPQELDETFGNPRLSPERSLHSSLGVAQGLGQDFALEITGFHKHLWDLVATSTALVSPAAGEIGPERLVSTGRGRIFGGELLLRKPLTSRLYAWLGYTLMRSEYAANRSEPFIRFDFDQTHILTLIASYELPKRWRIGARYRVVSGNPYTSFESGVFDASTGSYTCLSGPTNGARLPTFHQLDLRVDKRWVYRLLQVSLYGDILNVYNARNVEFLNYDYRCAQSMPVTSLPILPSVGTRIEW